jgi:S-DNA-T family DNA segregation ATPase FtsK/SpoIIIE
MSKRKTGRPEDESGKPKSGTDSVILQGIWGLVYLALGVLLFISMLFYSPRQHGVDAAAVHLLGPYLGTSLAIGMFYIFGRLTAFAFPTAVCYIGFAKLTGRPIRWKLLLFLAVLTIELCLLLAVGHMPVLKTNGFWATIGGTGSNFIGALMVYGLVPLFGGRMFGPYFIISLLTAITIMVALRIKPQTAGAFIGKWFAVLATQVKKAFADIATVIKNSPDIRKEPAPVPVDDKKPVQKKRENKALQTDGAPMAAEENISVPAEEPADVPDTAAPARPPSDGAGDGFDEAPETEKKRVPIVVITEETPEIEPIIDDDTGVIPPYTGDEEEGSFKEPFEGGRREGRKGDGDDDDDFDDFKVDVFKAPSKAYVLPSPHILPDPPRFSDTYDKEMLERNSEILVTTLGDFGIKVVGEVGVSPGPVVTRYEMKIEAGVKVSRVVNLQDDISLAVGGLPVRIQAPIPGKAAIGIELPNQTRQEIPFKRILTSDLFKKSRESADIPVVIGTNISGAPYVADIAKTPHLLIAGTTGSGKSVCMNSLICSMLMSRTPEQLRLIMIDPKVVEMANFADIPHLLAPVVTEPKEAVKALQWGVNEMERRYKLLGKSGAKKLETFNERVKNGELAEILNEEENTPLPLIVIIIDELADLMMTASKDVEGLIMRITQKARAAGIHLIVATQRPSVDIVTGKIKSNLPSRIGFRTVQAVDSRTILDRVGAEKLLGLGDMLFLRNGATDIERFHGAFISEKEVELIVDEIKAQGVETEKIGSFHDLIDDGDGGESGGGDYDDGKRDSQFAEAAQLVVSTGLGSTSLLQRRLGMGFARAGRVMDQLERAGVVGPSKGSKAREVLMLPEDLAGL